MAPPVETRHCPTGILLTKIGELRKSVDHLEDANSAVWEVKDASGKHLVDEDGIAADVTDELRQRLDEIRNRLLLYGMTWTAKHKDDRQE